MYELIGTLIVVGGFLWICGKGTFVFHYILPIPFAILGFIILNIFSFFIGYIFANIFPIINAILNIIEAPFKRFR